jgi:hypothetical protein
MFGTNIQKGRNCQEGRFIPSRPPALWVTQQGMVGTAERKDHHQLDARGKDRSGKDLMH